MHINLTHVEQAVGRMIDEEQVRPGGWGVEGGGRPCSFEGAKGGPAPAAVPRQCRGRHRSNHRRTSTSCPPPPSPAERGGRVRPPPAQPPQGARGGAVEGAARGQRAGAGAQERQGCGGAGAGRAR
jgi:hypothetical protein